MEVVGALIQWDDPFNPLPNLLTVPGLSLRHARLGYGRRAVSGLWERIERIVVRIRSIRSRNPLTVAFVEIDKRRLGLISSFSNTRGLG